MKVQRTVMLKAIHRSIFNYIIRAGVEWICITLTERTIIPLLSNDS